MSARREYRSLTESAQAAASEEQQRAFQAQAERYYSGRVGRARQMDTAFKTLHTELTGIKAGLARFFDCQGGCLLADGPSEPPVIASGQPELTQPSATALEQAC